MKTFREALRDVNLDYCPSLKTKEAFQSQIRAMYNSLTGFQDLKQVPEFDPSLGPGIERLLRDIERFGSEMASRVQGLPPLEALNPRPMSKDGRNSFQSWAQCVANTAWFHDLHLMEAKMIEHHDPSLLKCSYHEAFYDLHVLVRQKVQDGKAK